MLAGSAADSWAPSPTERGHRGAQATDSLQCRVPVPASKHPVTAVEVDLAGSADALQAARCALRSLCADRMHGDLLLDAELLIGELATDVLADGGRRVILHARLAGDRLFVEVIGQDSRFESDNDCATGRGFGHRR